MHLYPRLSLLVLFFLSICAIGGLGSLLAEGSSDTLSYTVRPGDTLSTIADAQGIAAADLTAWYARVAQLSDLKNVDLLSVGEKLTLPTATSWAISSTTATISYLVKSGDTLSTIADNQDVHSGDLDIWLAAVQRLNSLTSPDMLSIGQQLKLPQLATSNTSTSTPTAPSTTTTTPASPSTKPYTVQTGDSLLGIAIKQDVADSALTAWVASVIKLNNLASADSITAGAVISIPSASSGGTTTTATPPPVAGEILTYVVQPSDTLASIAALFGVSTANVDTWVTQVIGLNQLSGATAISAGQQLLVPAAGPASDSQSIKPQPSADSGLIKHDGGACTYTVLGSDTWAVISQKLGISSSQLDTWIHEIATMNGTDPYVLPVGDGLRVPC